MLKFQRELLSILSVLFLWTLGKYALPIPISGNNILGHILDVFYVKYLLLLSVYYIIDCRFVKNPYLYTVLNKKMTVAIGFYGGVSLI